ncbi:MAG TPA: CofH family radical SAM protein [Bacteroidales bacterium]|nr:CofH family radical SAM protein [Bacteroidales bacterium]
MNKPGNSAVVDQITPPGFLGITRKVTGGVRITPEEGLLLFEKAGTGYLGALAEIIKNRKSGNEVYFIRNFHIEPTNICVNRCCFCSYSHHFSKESWDLGVEEMLETVRKQDPNVREVHITGAVHLEKDLEYYGGLLRKIKAIRPDLHIKALSAVELDYMIRKAGRSYREGLEYLQSCGLGSIPGGGAEILDDVIREQICPTKVHSNDWLKIHETAHELGITSNATMLYGHIENYRHRIDHLKQLRDLQDRTGGFNAFIPLKFRNANNELSELPEVTMIEDMRNYAVSAIFLDNFPHLKGYWPMSGKSFAQLSLSFGVDDLDGTINDSTKIYSTAGSAEQHPAMTVSEMQELIRGAGKEPVERDSLYRRI